MVVRTSLCLPRRSIAFEAFLALLSGASVSAVSWTEAADTVSTPTVAGSALALTVSLFLFRRAAPLLPLLAAAFVSVLSAPAVGLSMPLTAYAVGRYTERWPVRVVAAVLGTLAITRVWAQPGLEEILGGLAAVAFSVLLPLAIGAWVRTRADLMAALTERAERAEAERELLARDAVLTERTRIAREMHDAVGHRVSLMVLQAGAIEMAAADRDRVEELACQVQTAGRQALDELRQAVGVLRAGDDDAAPLTPQPGLDDLDQLVGEWRAAGMAVELRRPAGPAAVDPVVSRAAYRIVQEALTNAGRHAPGSPVTVEVERPDAGLVVRVLNKAGSSPVDTVAGGGFGLVGLGERVRTLGGRLTAEPRLDGGFLVEAVLPS